MNNWGERCRRLFLVYAAILDTQELQRAIVQGLKEMVWGVRERVVISDCCTDDGGMGGKVWRRRKRGVPISRYH